MKLVGVIDICNFYPLFLCRVLAAILKMADILKSNPHSLWTPKNMALTPFTTNLKTLGSQKNKHDKKQFLKNNYKVWFLLKKLGEWMFKFIKSPKQRLETYCFCSVSSITPPSFMKFCPVVPEICRGQVHGLRKERRRITIIIIKIIIRNGEKTISLQTLSETCILPFNIILCTLPFHDFL
jgi:hypothetical protein